MTPPPPNQTPAPSIVGGAQPPVWAEYVPDAAKTADENAALKTAHDATKPAAPAAPAAPAFAPIDFTKDIKLPEGVTLDMEAPLTKSFIEVINDPALSRPQLVEKLLELQAKSNLGLSEKGKTDWEQLQASWEESTTKDPSVGGDKLPGVTKNIGSLLDQYGAVATPDKGAALRGVFDLTGAGNHPEMVKFLNWVHSKLGEAGPTPPPNPAGDGGDPASKMFPSMKK